MHESIGLNVSGASKNTSQKASNKFVETMGIACKHVTLDVFYATTFQKEDNLDAC